MKPVKLLSFFLSLCLSAPASAQQLKGDVNHDNKVDISDVVAVINVMAGFSEEDLTDMKDEAVINGLCPDSNHPHAIDLGIGVRFACCNVGAAAPCMRGRKPLFKVEKAFLLPPAFPQSHILGAGGFLTLCMRSRPLQIHQARLAELQLPRPITVRPPAAPELVCTGRSFSG